MALYYKTISESEAFYSFKEGNLIRSGGGQRSYNLPKYFYEYMTNKHILIEEPAISYSRKNIDGNAYVLNDNYNFKLGSGILSLIGKDYDNVDNQFIASMNGTNNKFQIYRKVYNQLGWKYGWFVELYDKNLSGNQLILDIDEKNKIFMIDISFTEITLSKYLEFINNPNNTIDI